ncbi:MAG: hypothetical protein QXQ40_00545 [Candidatus Aenigmatarchaeota archaeon]
MPIWSNIFHTRSGVEILNACQAWSSRGCNKDSLTDFKDKIGCSELDECRNICRRHGFCW